MVRARKRFGQHFLADPGILQRMTDAIGLTARDRLLEIGPGRGALTEYLHGLSGRYVAVEIDRDLVPFLKARFADLEVINADILRVPLAELLAEGDWRVVGNLPYNITSPLLARFIDVAPLVRDMHFMVQREVAERLAAVPGTKAWGRMTVQIQYYCDVQVLFEVPPESFEPPPRVWSAVVRLVPRPAAARLPLVDANSLTEVLRVAFSQRRKRLANAVKSLNIDLAAVGLDPGVRPDQLSVADYVALANAVAQTNAVAQINAVAEHGLNDEEQ